MHPMPSSRPFLQGPLPIAFAHRGGSLLWPENTMLSFGGAVALGCRYLETDVHLTKDGVLVTIHDATVDRITDGSGLVRAMPLAELKGLDAGYRFSPDGGRTHPSRGRGATIPTLAEVVEAFPQVLLNIDLKRHDAAMVEAMAAFIEERGLHDRLLIASFSDGIIKAFRRRTEGRVATAAAGWETRLFWLASRLGPAGVSLSRLMRPAYDALQVPPRTGRLSVADRRLLATAHRRGVQVHVWTVDDPAEMRRLRDLGVDGIMSDRPDLLLQVLAEQGVAKACTDQGL
jgi:glycerophosphoryl diester phosphodiesterase